MEQILPGLIIGVAVAISGAFVSHLFIRSREKERWEREDRRQRETREHVDRSKRETREHEWLLRHRDDRLDLYRRLLSDLSQIDLTEGTLDFAVSV
jgi:transposase